MRKKSSGKGDKDKVIKSKAVKNRVKAGPMKLSPRCYKKNRVMREPIALEAVLGEIEKNNCYAISVNRSPLTFKKQMEFQSWYDYSSGCISVVKKINLSINIRNENSIFQPVERKEDREYFVLFFISWGSPKECFREPAIENGCPVFEIEDISDIRKIINSVQ